MTEREPPTAAGDASVHAREDAAPDPGDTDPERPQDYGGPKGYPADPGAAYESEPEAPDAAFSEPEHWLEPGRQQRGSEAG